jgi:hypothetical protein
MHKLLVLSLALAAPGLAAAAPPAPVDLDGLVSTPPADWEEQPASGMRKKAYKLPAAAGDTHPTEVVIFYFGKGQGGGVADNARRWAGMFEKAEPKVTEETINGVKTSLIELSGTYLYKSRPMDPSSSERREGHQMIGVVFESPEGPYFMRLVGPAKTVAKHRAAFLSWLRGFKKR